MIITICRSVGGRTIEAEMEFVSDSMLPLLIHLALS